MKQQSKIRIIHIFAPEIIKTDAANFREVVQRLTGKPTTTTEYYCSKRDRRRVQMQREKVPRQVFHAAYQAEEDCSSRERVKMEEEEDIWRDANSGGGFLGGFVEFGHHFPFMEAKIMDHHA